MVSVFILHLVLIRDADISNVSVLERTNTRNSSELAYANILFTYVSMSMDDFLHIIRNMFIVQELYNTENKYD